MERIPDSGSVKLSYEEVEELIGNLEGSMDMNGGIDGWLSDKFPDQNITRHDLDPETEDSINQSIFLCEQCGWWLSTSSQNEAPNGIGDICDDCLEEINSEEEE